MKIRNGFVSNSSSSSFIIMGKKININDINPNFKNHEKIYVLGNDLCEGQDVFKISTIEEFVFIKSYCEIYENEIEIIDANIFIDEDDNEIDAEVLPKSGKIEIYQGEKDYRSSNNINDLIERYDKDGLVLKLMQRYLRSMKLKEINNDKKSDI